jgi:hypothetical protein
MYIITIEGKEGEGAYSVTNNEGEQVLYMFEEEDDAERFAMLLETDGFPPMKVVDTPTEAIIRACEIHKFNYAIFDENDIVIPPEHIL